MLFIKSSQKSYKYEFRALPPPGRMAQLRHESRLHDDPTPVSVTGVKPPSEVASLVGTGGPRRQGMEWLPVSYPQPLGQCHPRGAETLYLEVGLDL